MATEPRMMLVRSDVLESAKQALATAVHPHTTWATINEILVALQAAAALGAPAPVEGQEEAAE